MPDDLKTKPEDPKDDPQDNPENADVTKLVTDLVNKTVTARMKKWQEHLQTTLEQALTTHAEAISTQLQEITQSPASKKDGSASSSAGTEHEREMADIERRMERRYEKRLKDLEAKAEKERQEREQERQARLQQEEREALANGLRKHGVPQESVDLGIAYYYTHERKVGRDEAGNIVWLTGDEIDPYKPLVEGIDEALGTDLGKKLLPPSPARGTGARGNSISTRSERGNGDVSSSELGQMLVSHLGRVNQ